MQGEDGGGRVVACAVVHVSFDHYQGNTCNCTVGTGGNLNSWKKKHVSKEKKR